MLLSQTSQYALRAAVYLAEHGVEEPVRVLEPVHPDLLDRRYLLGRAQCSDRNPCAAHDRWQDLAERIEA